MSSLEPFHPTSLTSLLAYDFQPPRPRVSAQDFHDLFAFIWMHDTETFEHSRYRLQNALVLQLFYYLGLHPTVALSEGLRYRDTRILLKKHNSVVRVALLIALDNREKFSKSPKHWRGRTMILADLPDHRHICPVTIFLSIAIADGAIDGVHCNTDFSTLIGSEWRGWMSVPYRGDIGNLSVLRRTGNKSTTISSCPIRPSQLQKMMQAQIARAGHETTYVNLLHDARMSAQRLKRCPEHPSQQSLLVGRGQARAISELFDSALEFVSITSTASAVGYSSHSSRYREQPLSDLLKIQLRYDPTRSGIILHLYEGSPGIQFPDILWPFVDAAAVAAPEPYYLEAYPDAEGRCSWCGTQLARIPMKTHLLRCVIKRKNYKAKEQLMGSMQESKLTCKWAGCDFGSFETPELAATHITNHLDWKWPQCEWDECAYLPSGEEAMHVHLLDAHDVYTRATIPTHARFCIECSHWVSNELDWAVHVRYHVCNPHIIYGPVFMDGILAAPRRCPYCLSQGCFLQMENHAKYIEHIEGHIDEQLELSTTFLCPHPTCSRKLQGRKELELHFRDIHAIHL